MFAELGLLASILLTLVGIGMRFFTRTESMKTVAGSLIVVGALSLVVQLWIYYRRWHNY